MVRLTGRAEEQVKRAEMVVGVGGEVGVRFTT